MGHGQHNEKKAYKMKKFISLIIRHPIKFVISFVILVLMVAFVFS